MKKLLFFTLTYFSAALPSEPQNATSSDSDSTKAVEAVAEPTECDEEFDPGNPQLYRGCQQKTVQGYFCQKWTSQHPHEHMYKPPRYTMDSMKLEGLGDHNYCRAPFGSESLYCYTTDPNKRWDQCVPDGIDSDYLFDLTEAELAILERLRDEEKVFQESLPDATKEDNTFYYTSPPPKEKPWYYYISPAADDPWPFIVLCTTAVIIIFFLMCALMHHCTFGEAANKRAKEAARKYKQRQKEGSSTKSTDDSDFHWNSSDGTFSDGDIDLEFDLELGVQGKESKRKKDSFHDESMRKSMAKFKSKKSQSSSGGSSAGGSKPNSPQPSSATRRPSTSSNLSASASSKGANKKWSNNGLLDKKREKNDDEIRAMMERDLKNAEIAVAKKNKDKEKDMSKKNIAVRMNNFRRISEKIEKCTDVDSLTQMAAMVLSSHLHSSSKDQAEGHQPFRAAEYFFRQKVLDRLEALHKEEQKAKGKQSSGSKEPPREEDQPIDDPDYWKAYEEKFLGAASFAERSSPKNSDKKEVKSEFLEELERSVLNGQFFNSDSEDTAQYHTSGEAEEDTPKTTPTTKRSKQKKDNKPKAVPPPPVFGELPAPPALMRFADDFEDDVDIPKDGNHEISYLGKLPSAPNESEFISASNEANTGNDKKASRKSNGGKKKESKKESTKAQKIKDEFSVDRVLDDVLENAPPEPIRPPAAPAAPTAPTTIPPPPKGLPKRMTPPSAPETENSRPQPNLLLSILEEANDIPGRVNDSDA